MVANLERAPRRLKATLQLMILLDQFNETNALASEGSIILANETHFFTPLSNSAQPWFGR
jgi:hypothetical protein